MKSGTRRDVWLTTITVLPLLGAGCSLNTPRVWLERTEEFTVSGAGLRQLNIATHNGGVSVQGEPGRRDIAVTARVRGGGSSRESAQACLAAIELVSRSTEAGAHELTWRWAAPRQRGWGSEVSYQVEMPEHLAVNAETHNGGIDARDLAAECRVKTHNGGVSARNVRGPLQAETHNGGISASISGSRVELRTHNGGVQLDATGCDTLGGEVVSHNGSVRIVVGKKTSAELVCATSNGSIKCSADLADLQASRAKLTGRLGNGGPGLDVRTHNGSVHVRQR